MTRRAQPLEPVEVVLARIEEARRATSADTRRGHLLSARWALREARAQLLAAADALEWCEAEHASAAAIIRGAVERRTRTLDEAAAQLGELEGEQEVRATSASTP